MAPGDRRPPRSVPPLTGAEELRRQALVDRRPDLEREPLACWVLARGAEAGRRAARRQIRKIKDKQTRRYRADQLALVKKMGPEEFVVMATRTPEGRVVALAVLESIQRDIESLTESTSTPDERTATLGTLASHGNFSHAASTALLDDRIDESERETLIAMLAADEARSRMLRETLIAGRQR